MNLESTKRKFLTFNSFSFIILKLNGVYSADTVTANYMQFWFRRSSDVKDAPRTGRSVAENVDKINEIIEVDR